MNSIKSRHLDGLILSLVFPIIIFDVINGFLLKTLEVNFSISHLYKSLLLFLIIFQLSIKNISLLFLWVFWMVLFNIGSFFFNVIGENNLYPFLKDLLNSTKVLSFPLFFFYFKELIIERRFDFEKYFKGFVQLSFGVIFINLFLGLLGLGNPQYRVEGKNIGYIGFFYSGNELSAIMLIVFFFLAYYTWDKNKLIKYLLLAFVCLFLSMLKSTKTTILGTLLVFSFLPLTQYAFLLNKKFIRLLLGGIILAPFVLFIVYYGIVSSSLLDRIIFFWYKLDLVTLFFSSRNLYAVENYEYFHDFPLFFKFFGCGETFIRNSTGRLSEIDFVDILTNYGFLGLLIVFFFLVSIFSKLRKAVKNNPNDNFRRFGVFYFIIIIILSNTAGHIFVSGLVPFYLAITLSYLIYAESKSSV